MTSLYKKSKFLIINEDKHVIKESINHDCLYISDTLGWYEIKKVDLFRKSIKENKENKESLKNIHYYEQEIFIMNHSI